MTKRVACSVVVFLLSTLALAERLPRSVIPYHYDLTLAPDLAAGTFDGLAIIEVRLRQPLRSIVLHSSALSILEATVTAQRTTQPASVLP
ncbi:MAG: Aminopeptidase, partial [Acidobacteria bacterium]|nr:Aminopeptidase [Acidobacteriota bacterium]